jgi:hypothetical protein
MKLKIKKIKIQIESFFSMVRVEENLVKMNSTVHELFICIRRFWIPWL